jgi:type IV fimbrial biogenesis protein FimT
MATSRSRLRQSGFTLVELMIVILLISIILAVAVPNIKAFTSSMRVRSAALDFTSAVMFARSEAMKRGAQVFIKAPSNNDYAQGWCVIFADSTAACSVSAPGAEVMRLQPPLSGVAITWGTTAGPIGFNTSGRLNSQVKLQFSESGDGDLVRCLTIDASGSATSKKGSC